MRNRMFDRWKRRIERDPFFRDIALNASLLTLRFTSLSLEAEWLRQAYEKERWHIRASLVLALILTILFFPLDKIHLGDRGETVHLARVYLMIPSLLLVFLGTFNARFKDRPSFYILCLIAVFGLSWPTLLILTSRGQLEASTNYMFPGVIETVLFTYFLLGLPFHKAAAMAWSEVAVFAMGVVIAGIPANPAFNAIVAVSVCALIATIAAYKTELVARALFHRTKELDQRTKEVQLKETARKLTERQRIKWLEGVTQVLRHELKTSTAAVGTCLELIDIKCEGADIKEHVQDAERKISNMHSLLSMVANATSIEAAVYSSDKQPLSINKLVETTVLDYQRAHGVDRIAFKSKVEASFVGNEARFVQMLENLLNNALDHAQAGTVVDVAVRIEKRQALVLVKNVGSALPQGLDIFGINISTRSSRDGSEEHLGLGLYLAKLIAEFHGGSVEARNCEGEIAVEFEVRIPTDNIGMVC